MGRTDKKEAWDSFFKKRTILMRLMTWTQRKLLFPKLVHAIKPYIMAGNKILDAGCGTALNTLYLCSLLKVEAYGLDISEEALHKAQEAANSCGLALKTIIGDVQNMPFRAQSFDIVWNQGVLEHFENPIEAISEMARVGKIVFVAVPRKMPLRNLIQKFKIFFNLAPNDIFHLYTRPQLVRLMSQTRHLNIKASGEFNALFVFSWAWACGISQG